MAKRKKIKLGLFDILFLAIAGAGFVFALIGIFIPWFATKGKVDLGLISGESESATFGLFSDETKTMANFAEKVDTGLFPIGVIQAFAIIGVVLAALCAIGVVLKAFDIVRIKGLFPFLFAGATIAVGILIAVFAYKYGGDLSGEFWGQKLTTVPAVGMYFCAIGTIAGGAAMLLKRG